ncbi:isoamylase early set domain-containing protein [Thermodesulfobacteriota bacterium]
MPDKKPKMKRRRVQFKLESPKVKAVFLMGDFNDWKTGVHPMKKNKDGIWEKTVMRQPGRYEYKFLVDVGWRNDPINDDYCQNCFSTRNNVLTVC